ncbi:DUF2493 domain-containing protein [Streptomyces sp. URMC 125]|uniref:DUF2493 domain-containing protein n=1 Tax=Streptomyces sp. URMC 125 TaxID=3423419 RepID=UPI003F1AB61A
MRILVTGSRNWTNAGVIESRLRSIVEATVGHPSDAVLVHGGCPRGADEIADRYARRIGMQVECHPADWKRYGRSAGFRRNAEMVKAGADICLAFILNNSRGASMTADLAERHGIPTVRYEHVNWLGVPWKAQEDDLIGGWCVTPLEDSRTPAEGAPTIADFVSEDDARHIADVHNKWLEGTRG